MARPTIIRTEQIVETARLLFLEHGYTLSTASIARKLNISEGSIFKRFKTKDALFAAAMGVPSADFTRQWVERAGSAPLHDVLQDMGREFVEHLRVAMPRLIMLRRASCMDPMKMLKGNKGAPPVVVLDAMTDYLKREKALGRFQAEEPRIAARMLVGALANFVLFEVLGFEAHDEDETEATIRGMVALLVAGSPSS